MPNPRGMDCEILYEPRETGIRFPSWRYGDDIVGLEGYRHRRRRDFARGFFLSQVFEGRYRHSCKYSRRRNGYSRERPGK